MPTDEWQATQERIAKLEADLQAARVTLNEAAERDREYTRQLYAWKDHAEALQGALERAERERGKASIAAAARVVAAMKARIASTPQPSESEDAACDNPECSYRAEVSMMAPECQASGCQARAAQPSEVEEPS